MPAVIVNPVTLRKYPIRSRKGMWTLHNLILQQNKLELDQFNTQQYQLGGTPFITFNYALQQLKRNAQQQNISKNKIKGLCNFIQQTSSTTNPIRFQFGSGLQLPFTAVAQLVHKSDPRSFSSVQDIQTLMKQLNIVSMTGGAFDKLTTTTQTSQSSTSNFDTKLSELENSEKPYTTTHQQSNPQRGGNGSFLQGSETIAQSIEDSPTSS